MMQPVFSSLCYFSHKKRRADLCKMKTLILCSIFHYNRSLSFTFTDQKVATTKISTSPISKRTRTKQSAWTEATQRHHCHRHWVTVTWHDHHTKILNIRRSSSATFARNCSQAASSIMSNQQILCREAILWFTTTHGHRQARWVTLIWL